MKNKLFLIIIITSFGMNILFSNEEDSLVTIHAVDTNLPDLLSLLAQEMTVDTKTVIKKM